MKTSGVVHSSVALVFVNINESDTILARCEDIFLDVFTTIIVANNDGPVINNQDSLLSSIGFRQVLEYSVVRHSVAILPLKHHC